MIFGSELRYQSRIGRHFRLVHNRNRTFSAVNRIKLISRHLRDVIRIDSCGINNIRRFDNSVICDHSRHLSVLCEHIPDIMPKQEGYSIDRRIFGKGNAGLIRLDLTLSWKPQGRIDWNPVLASPGSNALVSSGVSIFAPSTSFLSATS